IVFSTDNIIITQLFGPEEVTPYNIALKYFGVVTVMFTIITSTFWSGFTEAYHQNDIDWIKRIIKKVTQLWFGAVFVVIGMVIIADTVFDLWLGQDKVKVPFLLSLFMASWVAVSAGASIYGNFVTGISKMRLALCHSVVVAIVNIPLSIYLASNFNLGVSGVILATLIGEIPLFIILFIQYKKIINGTA
ncbi:MAG: polysaccharide biosynthesis protein, partial [Vicingaceae bacterium]